MELEANIVRTNRKISDNQQNNVIHATTVVNVAMGTVPQPQPQPEN